MLGERKSLITESKISNKDRYLDENTKIYIVMN